MSDTAAAPSAPASTPAASDSAIPSIGQEDLAKRGNAPAAASGPAVPSGERPRGPDGKFLPVAGEAAAAPPPPPKRWKVGEREIENPDDLYAIAAQKDVDRRALEQYAASHRELAALKAKLEKDPRALIGDRERLKALALQTLREEMEEESLTPEQRERRAFEREKAEWQRQRDEEKQAVEAKQQEAALGAARKQYVATIEDAMKATGLPMSDALAKRVAGAMLHNVRLGLNYPPAVIARQVKAQWQEETQGALGGLKGRELVDALPFLVDALNGLEDADLLKKLSPLGERLRRLNLEALGAAPPAGAPTSPPQLRIVSPRLQDKPKEEWTPADWQEEFDRRARE